MQCLLNKDIGPLQGRDLSYKEHRNEQRWIRNILGGGESIHIIEICREISQDIEAWRAWKIDSREEDLSWKRKEDYTRTSKQTSKWD